MTIPSRRALFTISSPELGHATRSLAVILNYLNQGWSITIISSGDAFNLLRHELGNDPQVDFKEMVDYPCLERGTGWRLYWHLFVDLLETWRLIRYEHRELKKIEAGYGFYSRTTPCFILTHQVAFMPPPLLRQTFRLTERVNLFALRRFDVILIPDFPSSKVNLSGLLSHSKHLARCPHSYVGILSSYDRLNLEQDIDYLFIISGYLLEHKEAAFIRSLLKQSVTLPGKKVFVLGQQDIGDFSDIISTAADLEILPMVDGLKRQKLFNRARRVISRAGYTTVMDLVEHGKRGLLIPTPNQTEQEYLAAYLSAQNYFATTTQNRFIELEPVLGECRSTQLFNPPWRTAESLRKIHACIEPLLDKRFISIIVPAHNEEAELPGALACLLAQGNPAERYEIIVIENGSSDATLRLARQIADHAANDRKITVRQSARGVSKAKNLGLANTNPASEWVVICDADTQLGPSFLRQLNTWLNRADNSLSVGTCSILPRPATSAYGRAWFALYDYIHRWTKTSYALQIADTAIARNVGFNPELEPAEDLLFIKWCLKHGRFFFFPTDQVSTSTRCFVTVGYLRLSLRWIVEALLPMRYKRLWRYHVIR
jgi:UDP-N-acetylglucosamine transferase subunit ALG13